MPEYQGGFLLDGGIHQIAVLRLLLGTDAQPATLSAYSSLLQKHLPPHDTITSIWQTKDGISGTFAISFGSTYAARDTTIIAEKGSVSIVSDKVIVRKFDGETTEKAVTWGDFGVKNEVAAWAASLEAGKPDPKQSPGEALADLELLEKMLQSGEEGGKVQNLTLQP